jgi:hypothetical protein
VRLDIISIYNRGDPQRELRALIFLPGDHRNKNPRSGSPDVLALWYGETEFPNEGHQERSDLRDTWMNRMSVQKLSLKMSLTYANLQPIQVLGPAEKVSLHRRQIKPSPSCSIQRVENAQISVHP